jgi:hypothetical protein
VSTTLRHLMLEIREDLHLLKLSPLAG